MRNYELNRDRYYRTASFYLAAFLFAKGLELVNIDWLKNEKNADFIFADSAERELFLESFNFARDGDPEAMVDARKYAQAIKVLKDKLYQARI